MYSFLILTTLLVYVNCQSTVDCDEVSSAFEERQVITNWPFLLDCSRLPIGEESQCYVSDENFRFQFANLSLVLDETSPVITWYNVSSINETSCFQKRVTVERINTTNCHNDISSYVTTDTNTIPLAFGDEIRLNCLPGPNDPLLPAVPPRQYKTTWWRSQVNQNDELLPNETCYNYTDFESRSYRLSQEQHEEQPDSIVKYQATFYDPGLYRCEVQYDGRSVFLAHYKFCIENTISEGAPTVNCHKRIEFFEDEDYTIECDVHTSNAKIGPGDMEVFWGKGDSQLCHSIFNETNARSSSSKINCGVKDFPNLDLKCFHYEPSNDELIDHHQDKKTFKVFMTLRDIKTADQGDYTVKMKYLNEHSDEKTIQLVYNNERFLWKVFTALIAVLITLIAIFVILALIWSHWIQILLFIRRHIIRKYDEDGKEYVAIISYRYSNELPDLTKERTKKIVKCVQEAMNEKQYKFYDKHQHFEQGSTVETLLKHLNESHRMIIILTDAYVEESWSRFEAQQGYINMMKKKTKLIIIRTPGAKKALKKNLGKDFTKELNEAVKASRNIRWDEKMSDSRFKDHIIYALPNLKRSTDGDSASSTGNGNGMKFKRMGDYQRSVSAMTASTVAPSTPESLVSFNYEGAFSQV